MLKPRIACLEVFLLLLLLCVSAAPVLAEDDSPIAKLIQKTKDEKITHEELANALVVQAEIDQAAIQNPDTLILRFSGFAELIGEKMEKRVAVLIKEDKAVGAKQLELLALRMLGDSSKYTKSIVNLNRLNDQFERLVSRGTPDTVLAFRASLSSDIERELFLGRVDGFLLRIVQRHTDNDPPMTAIRNLSLLGDAARAAGSDDFVAKAMNTLAQQASQGAFNWQDWALGDPKVEKFVFAVAEKKPEVKESFIILHEVRAKTFVRAESYDDATKSFEWLLVQRPDPSPANNSLRRELASLVSSGIHGKTFATARIEELAELDDLGKIEEIYYYFKGYYGEGVLLATFLITIAVIVAIFGAIVFLGKYFPGMSTAKLSKNVESYRQKRLEKKYAKRGVGYMKAVDVDDEYSRLLAEFGLDDSASESDIKKAYRRLVKEHHPDAHGAAGVVTDEEGNIDRSFEELKKNYQRLLMMKASYFGG